MTNQQEMELRIEELKIQERIAILKLEQTKAEGQIKKDERPLTEFEKRQQHQPRHVIAHKPKANKMHVVMKMVAVFLVVMALQRMFM